jgi:predicted RNA binding protein YcfA (HicA-like mRNA interferase family)
VLILPRLSKFDKLRQKILDGKSDANISFEDLRVFLLSLGFDERIKGSHHIYRKDGIAEKPNLQRDGSKAKSYQLRQIREILKKYDL